MADIDLQSQGNKTTNRSSAFKGRVNKKIVAVCILLFATLGTGFLGGLLGDTYHNRNTTSKQKEIVLTEGQLINSIAKDVGPSVVSVNVTSKTVSTNSLFGFSQPVVQQSAGTGFIISSDGLILTNRHVVPVGSSSVSVTLSNGTELKDVEVVGRTNANDPLDVAFLKIKDAKGNKLQPVKLGKSGNVQVGDRVVAIGNALGQFQNTVTSGIISGYGRSIQAGDQSGGSTESLQNLFQTDAAINEGNSGGPLVNVNGEVIGINTATAGNAQNIGFAIPIDDARGSIDSVISTGKLSRPYLGVRYVILTDDYASRYNLNTKRGAYIAPSSSASIPSVISGSPADKAGLKEKDIITAIDGTNIDETHSLTSLIGRKAVGDKVQLTVVRDGKTLTLTTTLQQMPGS